MSWPPIGWSFVRGKIPIADHVFRVIIGEGTFIQRSQWKNGRKELVVVHEGVIHEGVLLYHVNIFIFVVFPLLK